MQHDGDARVIVHMSTSPRPLCGQRDARGKGWSKGLRTNDPTKVTCKKCRRQLEQMTMEVTRVSETNVDVDRSVLRLSPGDWVADDEIDRPRIAQVKDCYEFDGELLLDLVIYRRDGVRVGRESPACGGPKNFEPACPAVAWSRIEEPDWAWLSIPLFHWGDRVRRLPQNRY